MGHKGRPQRFAGARGSAQGAGTILGVPDSCQSKQGLLHVCSGASCCRTPGPCQGAPPLLGAPARCSSQGPPTMRPCSAGPHASTGCVALALHRRAPVPTRHALVPMRACPTPHPPTPTPLPAALGSPTTRCCRALWGPAAAAHSAGPRRRRRQQRRALGPCAAAAPPRLTLRRCRRSTLLGLAWVAWGTVRGAAGEGGWGGLPATLLQGCCDEQLQVPAGRCRCMPGLACLAWYAGCCRRARWTHP